jgi:hypothetical protein
MPYSHYRDKRMDERLTIGDLAKATGTKVDIRLGRRLVTDRDDRFYVYRQSHRGSVGISSRFRQETLHAKHAVSTRGVTSPETQNCLGDVVRVSFRPREA